MISYENMGALPLDSKVDSNVDCKPLNEKELIAVIFKDHFETGSQKNSVEELTSNEIAAMKFFCNVPYIYDPVKATITFADSSIIKQGTKWIVGVAKQ